MKNSNLPSNLENFLNGFPNNATNWGQATDEVRDIARIVRQAHNELDLDLCEGDEGTVEALDFRSFKTPSEWNTKAKAQINETWAKMGSWAKENALNSIPFNI